MKRFYKFFSDNVPPVFKSILNDTLKVDGKWSRTSLTMFTAWIASLHMAYYDLYKNGFHMEVFLTLVGVALGSKVTDSISKKIHKPETTTSTVPPTKASEDEDEASKAI
jgi:hypothetical protein